MENTISHSPKSSYQLEMDVYDLTVIEGLLPKLCKKHNILMHTESILKTQSRKKVSFPSRWHGTLAAEGGSDGGYFFELRPRNYDEYRSSESCCILSFTPREAENGDANMQAQADLYKRLIEELKDALDNEIPDNFINMEHFLAFLTIPMMTKLTYLAKNMVPNAMEAAEEMLHAFTKRESIHYEEPPSTDDQFGYQRVELRENHFEYIPYNEFTIYQKDKTLVAIGITREVDFTKGKRSFLTAWFSAESKDEINPLFGESFEKALLKGLNIKGGKFTGDQNILRLKEKPGMDEIKLEPAIREKVEREILGFFDMEPWYRKTGLPFKRGVALYGPPGTGKTLMARILAANRPETVIWVRAGDMSSIDDMDNIFRLARMGSPSIIILEDIDFYLKDRDQIKGNDFSVATMLSHLDGLEENDGLLIIVTTNRIELVEKAIVERPGRIDAKIFFGELGPEVVAEILEEKLKVFPKDFDSWEELLSKNRNLMTGAQAVELASMILRHAIQLGTSVPSAVENAEKEPETFVITEEAVKKGLKDLVRAQNASKIKGFGMDDI